MYSPSMTQDIFKLIVRFVRMNTRSCVGNLKQEKDTRKNFGEFFLTFTTVTIMDNCSVNE